MKILLTFIISVCCCVCVSAQEGFVWRPSTISMAIHRYEKSYKNGQFLHLKNKLNKHEYGWTEMKIDIPNSWKIDGVKFKGNSIVFSNQLKETFQIAPPKLNELDFEILNGGNKSDKELETIWRKHAKQAH